MGHAW